ncbi:hypothetical protein ACFL13_01235 [Patescibacteria group bacterium]
MSKNEQITPDEVRESVEKEFSSSDLSEMFKKEAESLEAKLGGNDPFLSSKEGSPFLSYSKKAHEAFVEIGESLDKDGTVPLERMDGFIGFVNGERLYNAEKYGISSETYGKDDKVKKAMMGVIEESIDKNFDLRG